MQRNIRSSLGNHPDYDVDVKPCTFTSSEMQQVTKVYKSKDKVEG